MQLMIKRLFLFILLLTGTGHLKSHGQVIDTAKLSSLMVYGDGFNFAVKEPEGWMGDTENAKKYHANVLVYKSKEDVAAGGPLIQVLVFTKTDEKTEQDLEYDVKSYKDKYEKLEQQNLSVKHLSYKCFAKTVFVKNDFYQYIVYVNPGATFKTGLSVAMNVSKRPATSEET